MPDIKACKGSDDLVTHASLEAAVLYSVLGWLDSLVALKSHRVVDLSSHFINGVSSTVQGFEPTVRI